MDAGNTVVSVIPADVPVLTLIADTVVQISAEAQNPAEKSNKFSSGWQTLSFLLLQLHS